MVKEIKGSVFRKNSYKRSTVFQLKIIKCSLKSRCILKFFTHSDIIARIAGPNKHANAHILRN